MILSIGDSDDSSAFREPFGASLRSFMEELTMEGKKGTIHRQEDSILGMIQ